MSKILETMDNTRMLVFRSLLSATLYQIKKNDTNYSERYRLVLHAVAYASEVGLSAGFRIDPQEPEWPVAYIELPTGQVSWHIPQHDSEWDGHDTEEKYNRVEQFIADDPLESVWPLPKENTNE
jgi:hypothetical protein